MTITIRQVSTTADGRQIVRLVKLDKTQLLVGRDSACDIHLADLAVDMQHARISLFENGGIGVEALGDIGFDVDGKPVKACEISPSKGAELKFGGHRLTIGKDEAGPIISVERIATVSDSTDEKDVTKLYTLKGLLPGRRISAWSFVLLVLAAFLAWPIYSYSSTRGVKDREAGFHADTMWSSGKLSLAHKSLENNCQACHVNKFEAVTDTSCLSCHKADAHEHADPARIANAKAAPDWTGRMKMFFQTKAGIPQGRCVECHTEHEGGGKMQPTAQQFCSDCHGSMKDRLTDTKLGNASDFGKLHPQFQAAITTSFDGRTRLTQRVELTGDVKEDNGLKFPHDIHLSKTNGIARMTQTLAADQGWGNSLECKDCHSPSPDGTRFQPVDMETNCAACHSLGFDRIGGTVRTLRHGDPAQVVADLRALYRTTRPAAPANISSTARRRPGDNLMMETRTDYLRGVRAWPGRAEGAIQGVFSRGGACFDCHSIGQVGGRWAVRPVVQPARYMMKGWFDHEPHKQEDCASCHSASRSNQASDLLLPDLKSCRTCHVGENGASLISVRKPVESSCAMCHDYHIDGNAPWKASEQANRMREPGRAQASKVGGF